MAGVAPAAIVACVMSMATPALAQDVRFNVPEQPAASGVATFARQADIQLIISARDAEARRTNAVAGVLSVQAGLQRLLAGTGLTLRTIDAKTYVAVAEQAAALDGAAEPDMVEAIVVTGSRIARAGFDASTPVSVLTTEDVRLSGTTNVEELLNDSPQFVPSTNGGAYGNVVPGGSADLNLRGFGASRNLVLVNGRRFTVNGPELVTDINTIPASLIKRTEIVTGGSSAVYGSDAITGVVNFITRDDIDGLELNAQASFDSPTRTPTYNIDLSGGRRFADGRGQVIASLNYLDRGAMTRAERGDFAPQWLVNGCVTAASWRKDGAGAPLTVPTGSNCRASGGLPGLIASGSGDIPNGRFTGVPLPGSSASNAGLNAALAAAGLGGLGSRGFTFNDAGTTVRAAVTPQDDYNLQPDNYLIVPQQRVMFNSFGHFDLTDKATLYGELHYSQNKVDQQLAPASISGPFLFNINNPDLTPQMREVLRQLDIRETGPTTVVTGPTSRVNRPNDGLAALSVARRLLEVGVRRNMTTRDVFRGVVGLKGELSDGSRSFLTDLSYDLYYSYAKTKEVDTQEGNISRSRFQAGLLSVNGAAPVLNIFGQNLSTAGVDSIIIALTTNKVETSQQIAAANISGDAFSLPAGPVGFSLGAEWRKSEASVSPDANLVSGDVVGFNPGLPSSGSIAAKEVFGEVRAPLLANLPLIQTLTANAAFRYSDYDLKGIGGVWTYLGGLEWRLNPDVALRGQYQRAVRAPNVGELYSGLSQSSSAAVDPCSNRQPAAGRTAAVRALCVAMGVPESLVFGAGVQPNETITAIYGGNDAVGVEESDTKTFGVVVTPRAIPNLAVSVDYFNIDLKGAIAPLGGGLNNTLSLCYNVLQDKSSEFCRAIARNPLTGEISNPYYVQIRSANTGALKTSGVDVAARYRFNTDWGFGGASRFDLSTNWTWTKELVSTPVEAFPNVWNDCAGAYGTTCGEPVPRLKGVSRVTWTSGPLAISLRGRYIGKVTVDTYVLPKRSGLATPDLADLTNPVLKARGYLDLSAAYDVNDDMRVTGGVDNLLNSDPPIVANPRANTYPTTYDALGMRFYVGASVKF